MTLYITIEILEWIAMVLVLFAFYLNTRQIISSSSNLFLAMNILSGLFMAINSGYHNAYPSMAANLIWLTIAAASLLKIKKWKYDRKTLERNN
ncbi:MAG TPA: hypothetical protein VGA80_00415 [Flavobacteriaceae bacterium]|jgi:hypothetical protein